MDNLFIRMRLKHYIYILVILLAGKSGTVQAQKGWQVGLRVTPLASWLLNSSDGELPEDSLTMKQTYGVAAGPAFGYSFNNYIGVMANILYSSQGQNHTFIANSLETGAPAEVLTELRLRYIKVPLLFKINTHAERKYVFAAEIGPQLSFLTSVDERDNDKRYRYPSPPYTYFTNFPKRYNTFSVTNIGAVLGVGMDVKLRFNLKMNLQLRMDYTFNDAENKDAKFNVTENGITREVNYYEYVPPIRPNYTQQRNYLPNRSSSNNLTLGLTVGFTYVFIPNFHYHNQ